MSTSQPRHRYAYLGPAGTFTEAALRQVASPETAEFAPQVDVVAAIEAVRSGAADHAVVAIENSVEGGVTAVLDTLAVGEPLVLLREMLVPVAFTLAARPGTALEDVRRIAAHPHAWAQCRRWLQENLPGVVHVPASSNVRRARCRCCAHGVSAIGASTGAGTAATGRPAPRRNALQSASAGGALHQRSATSRPCFHARPSKPCARASSRAPSSSGTCPV